MNETIRFTPRQRAIINLLAENEELSREQIAKLLSAIYPASKATFARDLKLLLVKKQIAAKGNGPSTAYRSASPHPLLKKVDLVQYFRLEPDERKSVKNTFNFEVFLHLNNLIFPNEREDLQTIRRAFTGSIEKLDQTIVKQELERFMIELSWKSSRIEGNTYTLLETETLIKESREARGHSKEEAIMILNHKDAFKTILEHKNDFKTVTLESITQLHNVLIKELSITGGIRKQPVGITGTTYRPLDNEWQIKEALEKTITLVNQITYPLEKALIIGSMLAYIQPFADGNKRTARMFTNALLLAYDLFPLSYRSIDENEYKSALILFFETNSLYHVKRLFLEQYRFALRTYFI
ncbi:Fic family protein [Patescibacteria group bacterium]|nr:Fic family protein [Patescibacteria group bacterium]MCL5010340.1 Fic family protein [Patescibacteria group bacterium]